VPVKLKNNVVITIITTVLVNLKVLLPIKDVLITTASEKNVKMLLLANNVL